MKKKFTFTLQISAYWVTIGVLLCILPAHAQSERSRINFNEGWRFSLSVTGDASQTAFDDKAWRLLDLPHDWSVEGTFDEKNPASVSGGALPGGIGWYRKSFKTPAQIRDKSVYIEFDGIYRCGEVWINGNLLGMRPFGYNSFRYELTGYLNKTPGATNTIAVKVDNSVQPNSRWYSGSGIYRNVWLTITGKIAVDHWGTYFSTPTVNQVSAIVKAQTTIRNQTGKTTSITLVTSLFNADNHLVTKEKVTSVKLTDSVTIIQQNITVKNPILWSDKQPYLYKAVTTIFAGNKIVDTYTTPIGIRYFNFDSEKGFSLNGKPTKILGVCNHHDLGCLGAAINTRALERQLELLRKMGCNGIRTSHNPPAPELLDLCDRMGFIVMDEAFDMWKMKKSAFDYSQYFEQWHKRDLTDMILRDRNHPSVFIWSIGNEIPEQRDTSGTSIAKELAAIVRGLDVSRPVTAACDFPSPENYIISSGALDLVGYNYHHKEFEDFPTKFPGQKFIATETTSALASRGSYDMPSDSVKRWPIRWDIPFSQGNPDLSCSSYDNCSAPWGSTHEETWKLIKKHDYMSGMFIWTGFDYLGEPTPYGWPAHSSYFGIYDLCGFPKDAFYLYQSEWTPTPVLHIFPHWNWKPGQDIDVWAYTNCQEVELLLNGKSLGIRKKSGDDLHLLWRVPFEPGTLTAIGRNNSKEIARNVINTASSPARISLTADRQIIKADGSDLCYVTVNITDNQGNIVPYASNKISFEVSGNATIAGVDSGDPTSLEPFKASNRKAYHGKCLLVVKSGKKPSQVKIKATADELETSVITIQTK